MRHMPIKAKPSASRIKSLWHKSMRPDHTTAREYSCTLSYALPADVAHAVVQYQVSPATNKSHQLDSLNACNHYHVFQWHRTATSKTDELSKYKTQQTQICYNSDCHASSYMNQHNTCKNVKLKYQCQLMNTQTNTHILTTKVLYQADTLTNAKVIETFEQLQQHIIYIVHATSLKVHSAPFTQSFIYLLTKK